MIKINKKDFSVGIVPLYRDSRGVIHACLVLHASGHWAFPKGHQNEGESEKGTALRELTEETGIKDIKLDDKTFNEYYTFEKDGVKYDKTIKYFFGFVSEMSSSIPEEFKHEIADVVWLPYEKALERSTFHETQKTLRDIVSYVGIQ